MNTIRKHLLHSTVPQTVVWVEKDLRAAMLSIESQVGSLILKQNRAGTEADYVLRDGHRIIGVSPLSMLRVRGMSPSVVYIGNYSAFARVSVQLKYAVVTSSPVYFNADGEMENPFS